MAAIAPSYGARQPGRVRARGRTLLATLLAGALAACQAPSAAPRGDVGAALAARPGPRGGGARLPAVAGEEPAATGWRREDGVWRPPAGAPADGEVRTDHLRLRSDLPRAAAEALARAAEAHVLALFARYGDALDLRFPAAPLPIVVHARRADFERALAGDGRRPAGWGAFYDARTGTVHLSAEPALRAPLPLLADLRHETTHQVLDLSTPPAGRWRLHAGDPLWLWEGFAIATEGLEGSTDGGPPALRRTRFERRRAAGETSSLADLFGRGQADFEGRHYDQAGVLVTWLLADGIPGSRAATLAVLRDALHGGVAPGALPRRLGTDAATLEARWRASLGAP